MSLEITYADGQLAALTRYKLGWPAPTNPTVANSAVLRAKAAPTTLSPEASQNMAPPTTPFSIARESGQNERQESQNEPLRKLSGAICTSCRNAKHYGTCRRPRAIVLKEGKSANFNPGMHGYDSAQGTGPAASVNYSSAVSSVSPRARASDGRPAVEQAASGFADLYRGQGINALADEPERMSGSLAKVSAVLKLADFMLPVSSGDESAARIDRMFRGFDNPVDTANVGGGLGDPQPGPAVLG